MKKTRMTRKTKDEKRRLLLTKKNVKQEARIAKYGSDSVAVVAKDMNHRFIAAFMALVFAISCMVVGINFATKADSETANLKPAGTAGVPDTASGMVLNKYLTANNNGKYDLTLEAYSTSQVQQITEKVPTDFVVVVDQSGSMSTPDMPTGTATVRNNVNLETVANGAYYYYDSDTGNYYRVYGVKDYLYRYYAANYWYVGDLIDRFGTDLGWFMSNTESTTTFANQMYFREVVNGTTYYQPITMTVQGKIGTYYIKFYYTSKSSNSTVNFNRDDTTYSSNGNSPWYKNFVTGKVMDGSGWGYATWAAAKAAINVAYSDRTAYTFSEILSANTGTYINYPMYDRHVGYTKLCYRDIDGVEHELASNTNSQTTWEFCNSRGQAITTNSGSTRPTYSGLYTFSGTTTRLAALKVALNQFAQAVADETDSFGSVDNKISIVGFSSMSSSVTHDPDSHYNYSYDNTELLTHTERDVSGTNGWQKNICDGDVAEYYGKGLVASTDGTVGEVNRKITNAVNALTANGGTQPEDGLNMAYQVLANRSATNYTIRSGKQKGQTVDRNTIVIFFTDGQPGNYHYSDQYAEANDVVESALPIKQYGASLFSIGVFGESDGNPLTYDAGNEYTTDPSTGTSVKISSLSSRYWQYLDGWVESYPESNPQYCLKREWRSGKDGYTTTANDTIFDYMSVTSSNYPDAEDFIAPTWISGTYSGTYTTATEDVRSASTKESTNKYYRMASNQDTLVAAFLQAVSMNNTEYQSPVSLDTTAILRDVLSSDFSITTGESEASQNTSVTCETVVGTMDPTTGDVTFSTREEDRKDITPDPAPSFSNGVLDYSGFDFTGNAIPNNGVAGKKLVLTITNIYPTGSVTSTDGPIYSNDETSGIYSVDTTENTEELVAAFPMPSISRHSYTLNVGSDNTAATFDYATKLVGSGGNLDDVIVVVPETVTEGGTTTTVEHRYPYSDFITNNDTGEFGNWGNGTVFYYENVPAGYTIHTSLKTDDNAYTYSVAYDDDQAGTQPRAMIPAQATVRDDFSFDDHQINITSEANTRNAFLTLTTEGLYANTERQFPIGMEITGYTGDITYKLNGSSSLTTLHFSDGVLTNPPDDLKLKHGDQVEFTNLPANSTVTITPSDDPGNVYTWTAQLDSGEATGTAKEGTIDRDGHAFHVVYKRGTVTETGVSDDGSHSFTYILAGIGVLTGGAGAAYVYRKKDEFVER